jgi:hypothetical protein
MPRAGNPNWGKSTTSTLTEFERKVLELGLSPDQYLGSQELRDWTVSHKNTRYVPEPLLQAWGLDSDFLG